LEGRSLSAVSVAESIINSQLSIVNFLGGSGKGVGALRLPLLLLVP
jgi:hypothetical protein